MSSSVSASMSTSEVCQGDRLCGNPGCLCFQVLREVKRLAEKVDELNYLLTSQSSARVLSPSELRWKIENTNDTKREMRIDTAIREGNSEVMQQELIQASGELRGATGAEYQKVITRVSKLQEGIAQLWCL